MDVHGKRDVFDVREALAANAGFSDADLSAAVFQLGNGRIGDADLSGAMPSNVNLSDVKIEKAIDAGMKFDGVAVSDLSVAYEAAKAGGK
ncbi:MAG TPA: hypothetical protein VGM46_12465 [Mesorhizobium sp.]|jgi:uncharacterized protein YjbI with pentapeptide repeats